MSSLIVFIPAVIAAVFALSIPTINNGSSTVPPFWEAFRQCVLRRPARARWVWAPIKLPHWVNIVSALIGAMTAGLLLHLDASPQIALIAGCLAWLGGIVVYTDTTQFAIPRTACWMGGVAIYGGALATLDPVVVVAVLAVCLLNLPLALAWKAGAGDKRLLLAVAPAPIVAALLLGPIVLVLGAVGALVTTVVFGWFVPAARGVRLRGLSDAYAAAGVVFARARGLGIKGRTFAAGPSIVAFALLPMFWPIFDR